MNGRARLVVATTNRGKLAELADLVNHLPLEVCAVSDVLSAPPHIVEDGTTFADNALKKARTVARSTGMLTLADDSGLEVDALGGRPGVKSARFARDGATDAENNAALLAALDEVARKAGATSRSARFRCVLALVDPRTPHAEQHTVEGVCEGAIERTPHGRGGFGYDPIFLVAGSDKTMAELPLEEKNRISHRARAWTALLPLLEKVLAER
ncbi:MAG: RdgB/HAM1 family non-canonical purine NTP pyrophosphatase [Polyangiaceae bacterium]